MPATKDTGLSRQERTDSDRYTPQIRGEKELDELEQRDRRAVVALFDLLQTHLSEYGGGRYGA